MYIELHSRRIRHSASRITTCFSGTDCAFILAILSTFYQTQAGAGTANPAPAIPARAIDCIIIGKVVDRNRAQ
ncbi:MAG: hypothetical protein ACPGF7_01385 [Pontibacterium sp.]